MNALFRHFCGGLFLSLTVSSVAFADESYDLSIDDVAMVPCVQPVTGEDRYDVNGWSDKVDTEYASTLYEFYLEGDFDDGDGFYDDNTMIEIAEDESWFRYQESDNNIAGTMSYREICLRVDFSATGDLASIDAFTADSSPTTWDELLNYVSPSIVLSVVAVPSTPMPEHQLVPFFYQYTNENIYLESLHEENSMFLSLSLYENALNPEDGFDLIVAIDQEFAGDSGFFYRDSWGDLANYGRGSLLDETDETNNVLHMDDFLTPWMTHLAAPSIELISSDATSFTLEWEPVEGATEYMVSHWKKNLNTLSEQWVDYGTQTDLEYVASLSGEDYLDCVRVEALDDTGVFGQSTDNVCMGQLFNDVDEGLWYTEYTHNATQTGIISGYTDSEGNLTGAFGPGDTITTTQALKMAGTLTGRFVTPSDYPYDFPYDLADDLESHWAYKYILSAVFNDYDLVEDLDVFEPNRDITRAEMVNLIFEAFAIEVPVYSTYSLTDISGHRYADEIQLAYDLGVVSGYGGTTAFGPDNSLLRAEAVKIFIEFGRAMGLTWGGASM